MPTAVELRPQPGFQWAFASTKADIAIGGGAAGAGKSYAAVLEGARYSQRHGFGGIYFRRDSTQLTGPSSLWDQMAAIYPQLGGEGREHRLDWRFRSGATIKLSHLQHESDLQSHHGKGYALIVFDEVQTFTERMFWYMLTRNRTTCGIRPYVRATCNPVPRSDKIGGWLRRLIDWWIDDATGLPIPERAGVLRYLVRVGDDTHWGDSPEQLREELSYLPPDDVQPKSFTFIPGMLTDNPALMNADPTYRASLLAQPRVVRERLLGGNWNAVEAAGNVFRRSDFKILDEAPPCVATVRGWDRAASEPTESYPDPDWTAGVKLGKLADGRYVVLDVDRFRKRAGTVQKRIENLAHQEPGVTTAINQDPGSAGKGEAEATVKQLDGLDIRVTRAHTDKVRAARPFAAQVEHGNVLVLRGPWNDAFFDELEAFPDGDHDDQVDAAVVAHRELATPGWAWA